MKLITSAIVFSGLAIAMQPIINQEYMAHKIKKVAALCNNSIAHKDFIKMARNQALQYIEDDLTASGKNQFNKIEADTALNIKIINAVTSKVNQDLESAECNASVEMNYKGHNKDYEANKIIEFTVQNITDGLAVLYDLNQINSLMQQSLQNSNKLAAPT